VSKCRKSLLILPFPGWLALIVHGMEVRDFMIPVDVCAANKTENYEEFIKELFWNLSRNEFIH
jgi:hypothetical protein